MTLNLGIVGISAGNGHPYSWAAIFNGYEAKEMATCGFPAIPEYLGRQRFPDDQIPEATVTHVWTQSEIESKKIANTCRIPVILNKPEQMIGRVDAILLARDDVDTTERSSLIDLYAQAGIPIFVDKPLALSRNAALRHLEKVGASWKLFSASALGFAPELQEIRERLKGSVAQYVSGVSPKSWKHYAVHCIEPAISVLPPQGTILKSVTSNSGSSNILTVHWESGLQATFATVSNCASRVSLSVYFEDGPISVRFLNTFGAFRSALNAFVEQVRTKTLHPSQLRLLDVIDIVEAGCKI
jgi:predicted dehydrogenase